MNEDHQERIQKGFEQFEKMAGAERAAVVRKEWGLISPEFEEFVLSVLSGEVWTRPGLDLKSRSLVTIAALTSIGRPRGLALNIEMGLKNGLTREEIREALVHLAFYAGFPAAWEALQTADEVFTRVDD